MSSAVPPPLLMTASPRADASVTADIEIHRPRLSIGSSLALLVAACLVPALVALVVMTFQNYRVEEAAVLGEAVTRSRTTMLLIERELDGIESELYILAQSDAISAGDLGRFQERLRRAQGPQGVRNYVLIDRDGRQRLNTLLPYGAPLPRIAVPTPVQPVFTSGKPVLSGVFFAPIDHEPIVTMGVPVYRGEDVAFALVVSMTPDQIIASTRHAVPDGWVVAVIDRAGRIAARTPDAAQYVGQAAAPSLMKAIEGRSEGTSETVTKDGTTVVTAFSRSPKRDWTIAVGAPKSMIVSSLHRSIAWLAVGALLALGGILWFAVRVSRQVTRAVDSLIEPALALGNGRPVEPVKTPFRETEAVSRAISQASRMLSKAQHHAYHDPLTDLRNRTLFDEMATRQIAQSYRDGSQLAILAIDLDGFKAVNDQHGHAAGDVVLKQVADRITGLIRGSDVVSRRGGDEFTVLLVDVDGVKTRNIAEKLLAALSQPYADVVPAVSASIGVARYPHDATTLQELLERADEALYEAKNAGKRRVAGDF